MSAGAYDFWRARLKGDKSAATLGMPQCGFWRLRQHKNGPFIPLAIFPRHATDVTQGVDSAYGITPSIVSLSADELNDKWNWANAHPISEAVWRSVAEHGKPWPDADVVAEVQSKQRRDQEHRGVGDNSGAFDIAVDLADRISTARADIKDFDKITDKDHADRSQSRRALLLTLAGEADDYRTTLKRPLLDEIAVVDGKWMPIVKGAKADADRIKRAQESYVTEQIREAERIAAEQAAGAIADHVPEEDVIDELTGEIIPLEPAPPPLPVASPANFRGSSGRAASVGTKTVVKKVTNWTTVFMQYRAEPSVQKALLDLASRDVEAGKHVDGVETEIVGRVK